MVFGADGSVFGPQVSPHIPKYPRAGENDPERVPQGTERFPGNKRAAGNSQEISQLVQSPELVLFLDGLPNPHPQQATKKSPRETLAKPETAGKHGRYEGEKEIQTGTGDRDRRNGQRSFEGQL